MERKQITGIAVVGLIVAAFLAFVTFKVLQSRPVPDSVAGADKAAEEEAPPPRRHGPKVKKKVDLAQAFTDIGSGGQDWGNSGQDWGDQPQQQEQEPQKEFHKQTPEEAVESVWQGLDTYREMSPEEKGRTQMAMMFVTGLINMMGDTAENWMGSMSPEDKEEALANAENMLANIDAIEAEVVPDMTEEEYNLIGTTLESIRNLGETMLNIN